MVWMGVRETLKWTEYLGLFCAVFIAYALDPLPRTVRGAYFISFAVAACSAFFELATGAGSWCTRSARPSFHESPECSKVPINSAATSMRLSPPSARGRFKPRTDPPCFLLALAGVALALTFSRAAFIGALLIVVVFAIIERKRAFALWPLGLGLAAGYGNDIAWALRRTSAMGKHLYARERCGCRGFSDGVGDRSELWRAARFFFFHHPILGIGAGNSRLELTQAGLPGVRTPANNWYLQAAAEGGVVLLGATIAWIVTVVGARSSPGCTIPHGRSRPSAHGAGFHRPRILRRSGLLSKGCRSVDGIYRVWASPIRARAIENNSALR